MRNFFRKKITQDNAPEGGLSLVDALLILGLLLCLLVLVVMVVLGVGYAFLAGVGAITP